MSIIKRPIKEFSKKELEESFWQLSKRIDEWVEREGIILDSDETYNLKYGIKQLLITCQMKGIYATDSEVSP